MYKLPQKKPRIKKPLPPPVYARKTIDEVVADNTDPAYLSMRQWLRNTVFFTSAAKFNQCPADAGFEIAFAGRSNAGKSSAINTLCDQNQLARASKTPGRTQMINFFTLDEARQQRIVDLPGYGYAAVPLSMKVEWQKELGAYLLARKSLQGLVLLMDIRHPLQDYDRMMLQWATEGGLFVHILLTKSDKLNRNPALQVIAEVEKVLAEHNWSASIQLFSSRSKVGIDELTNIVATKLHYLGDGLTDDLSNDISDDLNDEPEITSC